MTPDMSLHSPGTAGGFPSRRGDVRLTVGCFSRTGTSIPWKEDAREVSLSTLPGVLPSGLRTFWYLTLCESMGWKWRTGGLFSAFKYIVMLFRAISKGLAYSGMFNFSTRTKQKEVFPSLPSFLPKGEKREREKDT